MPTLFFVGGILVLPPPVDEIQRLARTIIEDEGMQLIDFEFKMGKSRNLLRIFIDKAAGVTLADCENISYRIGTLLDVKDLVRDAYILEVSSPGLDRPFKTDRDYERGLGRTVRVYIGKEDGTTDQLIGKLLEANDQEIVVESNGLLQKISRSAVKRAHQELVLPIHPKKNRKKRK